jgi:hypothetical protein
MEEAHQSGPVIVMLQDSPDAQLFVELSSHAADLVEARDAVQLAARLRGEGSESADAGVYLIGCAVVAYCRTVLHSHVRGLLTDHVEIPVELAATHEAIRLFRNATIAHSQSELSVTYACGLLDGSTLHVLDVAALTVNNPLPWTVVEQFQQLVATMQELLDDAIAPVRALLATNLMQADRAAMVAKGAKPRVLTKLAQEFNPRTKRPGYPTSHTVYWD